MRIPRWTASPPLTSPRRFHKPFSSCPSFFQSPSAHDHPTSWGVSPNQTPKSQSTTAPLIFETAFAAFAKRPSRAFPPPFTSRPSVSFSDPLTTYAASPTHQGQEPGQREKLLGLTNGDDALIVRGEAGFLGVLDGVGAWAVRERDGGKGKGNAALWSRLVGHFWARRWEEGRRESEEARGQGEGNRLVSCLQNAYEETKRVTHAGEEGEVCGTTTACAAALGWESPSGGDGKGKVKPVLYAANLGDCAVMVIRPATKKVVYKSTEQWHWFDCPRQLGTNSPDTPLKDAVVDTVQIEVGDVVLVVSDGVSDNLWDNEICRCVCESLDRGNGQTSQGQVEEDGKMVTVARQLMEAARAVAMDPFAESPFMERAVEEGLPMEGGKMDDISVVVGLCRERDADG